MVLLTIVQSVAKLSRREEPGLTKFESKVLDENMKKYHEVLTELSKT
jgi:hypothetical protein